MLRRPKHSKIEVVAPKGGGGVEEEEDSGRKVNILGGDNTYHCGKIVNMNVCLILSGHRGRGVTIYCL